ncbi:MAG: hypothetical protein IMF06_03415, partial [Proteobacteria bacterium]|nr:hypothetical protein [Pseudomonadota bacterium]
GNIEPPGLHYLSRDEETHKRLNKLMGVELDGHVSGITLFASVPLSTEPWRPFEANELIACKEGQIVAKLQL